MAKRILFTGFMPFGGEKINPSWEAVKSLPDSVAAAEVLKREIPVEYGASGAVLRDLVGELTPDFVVCVGQAGGRSAVSVECCAINRDHSDHPDNAGEIRRYRPILEDGAAAYFTGLPVEKIVDAAKQSGAQCAPSFSAGTYVCNHIYYCLLHMAAAGEIRARGLFVHVPYIPEQVVGKSAPSMELADIVRALETTARVLADS